MVGFTNEGNSCYLNAALACLIYTPYIANNYKLLSNKNKLVYIIKQIFVDLFDNKFDRNICIDTKEILKVFKECYPEFDNMDQHDSHDAFMCLIQCLPEVLENVYTGILKRSIQCNNCKYISANKENFTTLFLNNNSQFASYFSDYSIEVYSCDKCKKCTNAISSVKVLKLPKVIVVKSNTLAEENIYIDRIAFELFACVKYIGNTRYGHYTSCVKMHDVWYNIDDSSCVVTQSNTKFENSCLLFYKRV
jgi:ubiquitin C-terminal hydrolase